MDSLIFMAKALIRSFNVKPANNIIKQAEDLLATLTDETVINKTQREAHICFLKGMITNPFFTPGGDIDLALKYYKHSLALGKSLGDKILIGSSFVGIAWGLAMYKGEIDKGLEYVDYLLAFAKEANVKLFTAYGLLQKASLYHSKGEVTRSIPFYEQSSVIAKELEHKQLISSGLNNMADAYRMIGDLDRALECSKQSLAHLSKSGELKRIASNHDFLIQILIEKGDLEQAQHYFNQLEQLNKNLKDETINLAVLYNRALILKESPRISNKGKAEEILKQILEEKAIPYYAIERVLLTLCELLLIEFQMTKEVEVLDEIESLIIRLLENAEKSHSFWIMGETYLLQAKLALFSLDLKEARRLLTQGQKIAEGFGLKLLAIKISNEHDELLKQLNMWENFKESPSSLKERIEFARLSEQMNDMVRKRVVEPSEIQQEESVVILIISEGGNPIFSQSFVEGWSFQDHLFGGFLSAVNSFSDEMFSQGLDRAIFGEYTIIMNVVSPFILCYLFKGQSFLAQQRMKFFIDTIQNDKEIWETIEKYYQANQFVHVKDIPSLDLLVNEIFIKRAVQSV
ncbi:MAG: tetratricopeptide repeat protein [Promethearchaeota archaeon]